MTLPPELLAPARLWSRAEVLSSPSPVPREPGVYAWYFRDIPPGVPTADCHRCGDLTLLYIGIAQKAPPKSSTLNNSLCEALAWPCLKRDGGW